MRLVELSSPGCRWAASVRLGGLGDEGHRVLGPRWSVNGWLARGEEARNAAPLRLVHSAASPPRQVKKHQKDGPYLPFSSFEVRRWNSQALASVRAATNSSAIQPNLLRPNVCTAPLISRAI